MKKGKRKNTRTVVIASFLCILLCLSSGIVSAQLLPEKLEISAPKKAEIGEIVSLTVTCEGKPIEGVTIYANRVEIGRTKSDGTITYSFDKMGPYRIEAEKGDYISGRTTLVILLPGKELEEIPTPPRVITITLPETPVVKFKEVKPETPINLTLERSVLKRIFVKVVEKSEGVCISVEELKEKPPEVPALPSEISIKVYVYIEIKIENITVENIEEAEIEFKIEKHWLAEHGIGSGQITLSRYSKVKGEWEVLDTKIIGEDETHVYYSTKIPEFSTYAITAMPMEVTPTPTVTPPPEVTPTPPVVPTPTPTPEVTPTPTPVPPGFEAVFAIAGLLAVAYLVLKRRK